MARILVNYAYNKAKDEYKVIEGEYVLADMKVAVMETEEEIRRPLVVPIGNTMVVVDRDKYEAIHKRFYLVADEKGNVSENPNGAEVWLPRNTDIKKLRVIEGRLVLVEEEKKEEAKNEEKEQKPRKIKKTEA